MKEEMLGLSAQKMVNLRLIQGALPKVYFPSSLLLTWCHEKVNGI
jgi:hypothetical protein